MGVACSTYWRRERCIQGRPEGNTPFGRPRRRWRIILKWIFKNSNEEAWTGLIWRRIETGGRSL
jgi:hypothetical protein